MENNRYEETPNNDNIFVKILKMFGQYLKNLGYDFVVSFKYNNMKLPGILVAIPGILLGFFLKWHAPVATQATFVVGDSFYNNISFDYTGIVLFVLMLFGILNIFTGVTMSGKKNLGSVVLSTVCTAAIVVCGCLYIYAIISFFTGATEYRTAYNSEYEMFMNNSANLDQAYVEVITAKLKENDAFKNDAVALNNELARILASATEKAAFDKDAASKLLTNCEIYVSDACKSTGIPIAEDITSNAEFIQSYYISISSVIASMVSGIAGCVLGFIFYDRTYEKVDR